MADDTGTAFGSVALPCPECGEPIPVQVPATVTVANRSALLVAKPDYTDVWAHAWSHTLPASSSECMAEAHRLCPHRSDDTGCDCPCHKYLPFESER